MDADTVDIVAKIFAVLSYISIFFSVYLLAKISFLKTRLEIQAVRKELLEHKKESMRIDVGFAEHQGRLMRELDEQFLLIRGLREKIEALEGDLEPGNLSS